MAIQKQGNKYLSVEEISYLHTATDLLLPSEGNSSVVLLCAFAATYPNFQYLVS